MLGCLKFRREKAKPKSNFIRRMTTFGRGSPSRGRGAMLNAAVIATLLAGNLAEKVSGENTLGGPLKTFVTFHENVRTHVRHIYDTIRSPGRASLSRENFAEFLEVTQGVDASELLTQECYTFEEFFWIWSSNESAWHATRKFRPDELDASRPISNYFISSSHNTYLEGNQLNSKSSDKPYRATLSNGCRCIEIDVWNGPISRTPSKSPNPGHRRHLSSGSLPQFAAETLDALIGGRVSRHSRSPSTNQTAFPAPGPRESSGTLDPKDLRDRLEKSRESSRSSGKVEPVVHHHGTMTSTIGFREVCWAIRESAFKSNPLPIIISLEVGADREQQEVMVEIMKEEWAGLLLDTPFDYCDPHQRQPRLEELYNKILIKVKRLDDCRLAEVERGRSIGIAAIRAKPPICEALAALAIYTHSEHYEDEKSLSSRTPSHIFSLSEDSFRSLAEDKRKRHKLLTHNRDYFMRIYPKGSRVDSSNPDPSFPWRRGVQMVAMNWQKSDEGMMLNDAMFAGTNGWVLKPPELLSDHDADMKNKWHSTLDLRITVLAGQFLLPKNSQQARGFGVKGDQTFRPRVKVELHVEKPRKSIDYARETACGTTEHPDWGRHPKSLDFLDVKNVVEELSFVRFKVRDGSNKIRDDLISWSCIRLDRLQPGYRWVDLLDPGTRGLCPGKLFVKVEKVLRD